MLHSLCSPGFGTVGCSRQRAMLFVSRLTQCYQEPKTLSLVKAGPWRHHPWLAPFCSPVSLASSRKKWSLPAWSKGLVARMTLQRYPSLLVEGD